MATFPSHQSLAVLQRAFEANDSKKTAEHVLALIRLGYSETMNAYSGHPLEDDWRDFVVSALAQHHLRAAGHLYCVTNPVQPGFHKVGMTSRAPSERVAELTSAAVVGHFVLVKSWPVYDRFALEKQAHVNLEARFIRHKEFFHGSWEDVCEVVDMTVAFDQRLLAMVGLEPKTPTEEKAAM